MFSAITLPGGAIAFVAAMLLTGSATAQKVGAPAPEIEFQHTFNFGDVKHEKLSQLQGSAVLIEFWGTH